MPPLSPRDYGFRVLSRREHSVHEFDQKLLKKFPDKKSDIEKIKKEFIEQGWLSDDRFCEAFIHDKILLGKTGPAKIQWQLQSKGIAKDIAADFIEKFFPTDEILNSAMKLATKKRTQLRALVRKYSDFEMKQKLQTYLLQKGFSSSIAQSAVKNLED